MNSIKTEIVVVGAGPGGYAAAFYAADLGKKVILIEKETRLGGVCLNRGCIPSKALLYATHQIVNARESAHRGITFAEPKIELEKLRAWKESILAKLSGGVATLAKMRGVQVMQGRGYFEGSNKLRVETDKGQQFVEFDAVRGLHVVLHYPMNTWESCSRSAIMPVRIRVFTVPSGRLKRSASSDCVRPRKYASSISSR